ncbi:hypothetical protein C0431_12960 [bacterium]|nr:hypothetical protein [bacterium]
MISGYALISVNDQGKGRLYELDESTKSINYLDIERGYHVEMDDEEIAEMLTPDGQKDVLLMVFFQYCWAGGDSGFYVDDFEEWLGIDSFKVLTTEHRQHYHATLKWVVECLKDGPTTIGRFSSVPMVAEDEESADYAQREAERLIAEYEEFFGLTFEDGRPL